MEAASWLCATDADRQRLLDMVGRLRTARMAAIGSVMLAIVLAGPWVGFWPLVPMVAAAVVFRITDVLLERSDRPEYWLFTGWAFCQAMLAVGVVMTGGSQSIFVLWLIVPTVTLPARFTDAGLTAGMGLTALLIAGSELVGDGGAIDEPFRIAAPICALIGIAALTRPLMRSDVEHRSDATRDALTGLPNRQALERRSPHLLHEARQAGLPVGVLVADLDHFKAVNDQHGHLRGDAVLREAAHAMARATRGQDLVYRLGGEEFLVLLPGADLDEAQAVAERLRASVAAARPGGLDVSISVGVSATATPDALSSLIGAADAALYAAKRGGRNRVELAAEPSA